MERTKLPQLLQNNHRWLIVDGGYANPYESQTVREGLFGQPRHPADCDAFAQDLPHVTFVGAKFRRLPWLPEKLRNLHLSRALNSRAPIPFKQIWNRTFVFPDFDPALRYTILFFGSTLDQDVSFYLNALPINVKVVLHLRDSLHETAPWARWARHQTNLARFYVHSTRAARELASENAVWLDHPRSEQGYLDQQRSEEIDLLFTGQDSPIRDPKLQNIVPWAHNNQLRTFWQVSKLPHSSPMKQFINQSEPLDVAENQRLAASARVLVAPLKDEKTYPENRYREAVILDRLLLTDNEEIKEYPEFDPRFMKIVDFTDSESFNGDLLDWVKSSPLPNYGYSIPGRWTPSTYLERVYADVWKGATGLDD